MKRLIFLHLSINFYYMFQVGDLIEHFPSLLTEVAPCGVYGTIVLVARMLRKKYFVPFFLINP